jgi:hypothetical protein
VSRPSKRFDPSTWSERIVPVLLVLLLLALIITLGIIGLSMLGFTPGL